MRQLVISVALAMILSACAAGIVRNPVPAELSSTAALAGFTNVRFWGDQKPPNLKAIADLKISQMRRGRPKLFGSKRPRLDYLAISGGGSDGAFGAGLLVGWSEQGSRPQFDIVTGVSTGALAAPFAFLGSEYDSRLREIFTHYKTKQLLSTQFIAGLLGNAGGIIDNSGLKKLIAKYIDASVLRAIAREHLKGRRLLIGTTNLDAQRPVIWDIGAVAVGGGVAGLKLVRQILLASAALPGVFPPVLIDVVANGKTFTELHVDGGPTAEVFFLPSHVSLRKFDRRFDAVPRRKLFIIRNGKLGPEWSPVKFSTIDIARRSITTLTKNQSIGDLLRLYADAKRDRIDYNLAAIPADFKRTSNEPFDQQYMSALFDLGYRLGMSGYEWKKRPPRL